MIFNKKENYVGGKQTLEKTQERRRKGGEDLGGEISNINKEVDFLFYLPKTAAKIR